MIYLYTGLRFYSQQVGDPGASQPQPSPSPNIYESQQAPTPPQPSAPPPEQPVPPPTIGPQQDKSPDTGEKKPQNNLIIIGSVVILLVIAFVAYAYFTKYVAPPPGKTTSTTVGSTSSSTSTIPLSGYQISSCTTINRPGIYELTGDISPSNANSTCILIASDNVIFNGKNNNILGLGPFVPHPPYSYGIKVENDHNVTVMNVSIAKFSYDIMLDNTSGSEVIYLSAYNATMSGIYLLNSSNNLIKASGAYRAASREGGVYILNGMNNTVTGTQSLENDYYGFNINSTHNNLVNITATSNRVDLLCGSNAMFRDSNNFTGRCSMNTYCGFAECSNANLPFNVSTIVLSNKVSTCGTIQTPGVYSLAGSLNLSEFINVSNPLSGKAACLTITSSNIRLDCNNDTISNAWYGVYEAGEYNITLQDCNFRNDTYGGYILNSLNTFINGGRAAHGTYGLYISNQTNLRVTNITYYDNGYGIYANNTSGLTLEHANFTNNTYGAYVNASSASTSSALSFYSSTLESNKKSDLFCSLSTYNQSGDIFQGNTCGVSDCSWASCAVKAFPPLPSYPITECGNIITPGSYVLKTTLLGNGNCITISISNVTFNCGTAANVIAGHDTGSAFVIKDAKNVTLDNCNIEQFGSGISVIGSSDLNISGTVIHNVKDGIDISNSSAVAVIGANITQFSGYGINLTSVSNSTVRNDVAFESVSNATGFSLSKGGYDTVTGDISNGNKYGFVFSGSTNDHIANNSAASSGFDYQCLGSSTGLYAENTYQNYGVSKDNCLWMVEINPTGAYQCPLIYSASYVLLPEDMYYTYGVTCFTIDNTNRTFGNDTIINCNNHTIYASNGGTFLRIINSSDVLMENCYLKGFTYGVKSTARATQILNNTIGSTTYAVYLNGSDCLVSKCTLVADNNITESVDGIIIQNSTFGTVRNNIFTKTNTSISMDGGSNFLFSNNTANRGGIGISLLNSITNQFQSNLLLNESQDGIICTNASVTSRSNMDNGGNVCSSNAECSWMKASSMCQT